MLVTSERRKATTRILNDTLMIAVIVQLQRLRYRTELTAEKHRKVGALLLSKRLNLNDSKTEVI